jgi:cytochrome c biogenesis protein CcdA
MFTVTLVGSVRKTVPAERGDEVVLIDDADTENLPRMSNAGKSGVRLSLTVPAVALAGLVDGFNPCSFAIMISLAGILAIGGRRRKARILGGLAFCAGTFATYMLMGFGLLHALRALRGLRILHDVMMSALALALFALSFLSFRDALRFHRVPVFSVVTLRLPEGVKNAIRRIALSSWSGPAVVLAGLGCAFLVTLLDALCTGQVYVPVLALLAKEDASARAAALLVLYNLAFIAPLVGVFVLASKTTDAFQMAKWSSRNVIPAKIALGLVFALLGWMLWPKSDVAAVSPQVGEMQKPHVSQPPDASAGDRKAANDGGEANRGMSDAELADGNERLDELLRAPQMDPAFPKLLASVVSDRTRDEQWRNHCLQVVPDCMMRLDKGSSDMELLSSAMGKAILERSTVLSGTALLGYARLSEETGIPSQSEVAAMAVAIASDSSSSPENVVTALRVCVERGVRAALPAARYWARCGNGEFIRCVAISSVRDLGGTDDVAFLRSLLPARTRSEESMVKSAIEILEMKR